VEYWHDVFIDFIYFPMKKYGLIVLLMVISVINGYSQNGAKWSGWSWLMGTWEGDGKGKPGSGSGIFTLKPDLDSNILVRTNHTVYPPQQGKGETIHDDLMIVYPGAPDTPSHAVYFDNEGHIINYLVMTEEGKIVLTSEQKKGMPVFRLSYIRLPEGKITVRFEMASDGANFFTYVEGDCIRKGSR
jgi:hypothetical protein